ncbi:MAG: glycosyltransferase family 4 protein [bacterium]
MKDRKAKKRFLVAGYIGKMLLDAGIEHLHAHFANDPASVARFVHVLTGISYSFTAHAKDIYLSNQEALRAKIHEAKFVITCTNYNRTYLQGLSVNGTPIHTIYHGLDESIFGNGDGAVQQFCCKSSPNTRAPSLILSVGRLVEKKGFDCLIAACHLLHYWGIPFRCQIIGEGPLDDSLRRDIGKFQIEKHVEILKFIPQQQLVNKYHEAALFALPCQISENGDRDGIPNVLVEAMATGLPVVATRVSGISEVIDPLDNGFLVPPKNPWALAEALKEVLLKPEDYRYLGINGKKTVRQNFRLTSNVARLKNLFEIH